MNNRFELTGPLTELSSYPQWAQDMVGACEGSKQEVLRHELWALMCEARLSLASTRNFMVGIWPVIERFPGYMAHSLLKTQYGRSPGDNLARRWLVRNIRVEQNHADHWLKWAEGAGVPREEVLRGSAPMGSQALAQWCEEISSRGSLAASIAATNYAVEGATGEWSQLVYDSPTYAQSLPAETRTQSLRWLQLHAAYDDTHPWEALEIVCTLVGNSPAVDEVEHLAECIRRSYTGMRVLADRCVGEPRGLGLAEIAAA
ncbi:TenA family transcriptional regulator [Frateuria sp. Soil773]|uniref:TenA family transcriptional regulator n=1 Tax=Frateuria sp. Soil773 TaxID=1736407 RepID=UPI0006F8B2FF|nr:iron-containing redox enzyme family protein [Frateuria sp. Soil773]KRE92506.1 TenA family transcriptional regulator [Frateuria sp. Soil773]